MVLMSFVCTRLHGVQLETCTTRSGLYACMHVELCPSTLSSTFFVFGWHATLGRVVKGIRGGSRGVMGLEGFGESGRQEGA